MMNRRNFLKATAAASLFATNPGLLRAATNYQGKFLVTVHAAGGWDPTSFCDPKMNVPGERIINNWATTNSTQTAGNINYAPFADNAAFFNTHFRKMLVFNGIDVKSNSHTTGTMNNMTGIMKDGYPSLAAIVAASNKTEELMPWLTSSSRAKSGKLLPPSVIANSRAIADLKKLAKPNLFRADRTDTYLKDDELALIRQFRQNQGNARANDLQEILKQRAQYTNYLNSTYSDGSFEQYLTLLETVDTKGLNTNTRYYGQAASIMSAFKAGISLSADISIGGFDTHGNHDVNHARALTRVTTTVDLLWYIAEQYNIQDRLLVHIISDFGRTNRYNGGNGKDHWSITSSVLMGNNPTWGNRVVGSSNEAHRAEKINFNNLQVNNVSGTVIEPRHIMTALRQHMNVESQPGSLKFDLNTSETPDFFNPGLMT